MENIFNLLQIKLEKEKKINFLKKIFLYFWSAPYAISTYTEHFVDLVFS